MQYLKASDVILHIVAIWRFRFKSKECWGISNFITINITYCKSKNLSARSQKLGHFNATQVLPPCFARSKCALVTLRLQNYVYLNLGASVTPWPRPSKSPCLCAFLLFYLNIKDCLRFRASVHPWLYTSLSLGLYEPVFTYLISISVGTLYLRISDHNWVKLFTIQLHINIF